jgi:hypothetical protein
VLLQDLASEQSNAGEHDKFGEEPAVKEGQVDQVGRLRKKRLVR